MSLLKNVTICALLSVGQVSFADVLLGQSAALTGPTSALGIGMKVGARAYFNDVAQVKLKTANDRYEPEVCMRNTNNFIARNIDALFGYVGTPTAKVCAPLAMKAKKIFFGAYTGAGFLSDEVKFPYSFSVRASYEMETEKMVDILSKSGKSKIAIFVQDDGFGNVGKTGVLKALKKRGLALTGEGRYQRNTVKVDTGVDKIIASSPDAIITVGAYKPCAAAIKALRAKKFTGPIINISFVGSKALAKELKGSSDGVYISQVVPSPWDNSLPIVKEYQSKVKAEEIGFISFEGYISAKIFDAALKKVDYKITSADAFKKEIESLNLDLGGIKASFSAKNHRALSQTYITKINKDGTFTYIDKM